ncbi:Ubiquitin carboxyl-terminal hydrolase 22 [Choanephora cucurbitarum]|uniref:Ubiquitin carboxyl-terminal hydrolase n=1 Tax=Choanephora cucurbitarum TaxID=101091 RepID=A0A1C7MYF9_9FUNG|nr:Ubiquitin carboxyl-terminal hydrolase 22 [Choanephora cucurbitarum]
MSHPQAPNSPLSPLSPLSPSQTPTSPATQPKTIYDILYSKNNPPEFYGPQQLIQSSACSHLAQLKQSLREGSHQENILENYRALVQYSLVWHKSRKSIVKRKELKELPLPQCTTCLDPLSRLHACLHCVYLGCWKKGHMKDHQKEKKHIFAMEFDRHAIFCSECDDYVYDVEIDEKITRHELMSNARRKKQKVHYVSWEPTKQEIPTLVHHATINSCQGIRGLCNMGNTCFMNVILQSFVHNPLLKAYFLSDRHNPKHCQKQYCMCCEMDDLFTQFYSDDKKPYGPCRFLQSMWMSLKELAGYAQQDAHEFFISALNNIHAGCKEQKLANCECIIHKTFAGLLQSNVTCLRCRNVTTTCDPMLDISLGLRPVEKKKSTKAGHDSRLLSGHQATDKNGRRSSHDDPARANKQGNTLLDCLDRYTQPEKLGPNEYSCSKCGNTFQEATKQLSIKRIPPVLSIQLKRFEHGTSTSKIETKIKFPVELDLTPYTSNKSKDSDNVYTLFSVVNHQGKVDTGHYTMFAKHRNEWFRFDDHNVTLAYQKDVLDSRA